MRNAISCINAPFLCLIPHQLWYNKIDQKQIIMYSNNELSWLLWYCNLFSSADIFSDYRDKFENGKPAFSLCLKSILILMILFMFHLKIISIHQRAESINTFCMSYCVRWLSNVFSLFLLISFYLFSFSNSYP